MHKISCFKRAEKIYIGGSCPGLGIGISVSGVSVGPSVIDPNEVCCITRCTFLLTYIIARARDKLKRPTKKSFYVFSFDDTIEKVAVKFEGEKSQDAICEITLCKYLDPGNKLPIDQSIRILCVVHPVQGTMESFRK